jgi:hypothetical protein
VSAGHVVLHARMRRLRLVERSVGQHESGRREPLEPEPRMIGEPASDRQVGDRLDPERCELVGGADPAAEEHER